MLVKCLGVPVNSPPAHDVVLVDASQLLLYHVVWPVAGTAGGFASIFSVRLSRYPPEAPHCCCLTAISMSQLRRTTRG